ncbi:MAG: CaiB/BaiF CoA-transferase family protein, partial [Actinomycetes bacterium]
RCDGCLIAAVGRVHRGVPVSAPLAGVRVLDLTRLLPGNFCTLLLAGLGADVVKIEETVGGDGIRYMFGGGEHNESGAHAVLNRGKRSLCIDLKSKDGQLAMLDLVKAANVLVDSFRPGVLDRLGLGRSELERANPSLVHVSINAFGDSGPYRRVPAHDLNAAGYAGALSLVEDGDGTPAMPAVQNADMSSGMHAALAVVAGLRAAERDGEFYRADVAMTDSAASLLALPMATFAATGAPPSVPDLLTGQLACYRTYRCADGKWITVGGLEAKFFGRMVELMGVPEFAARQYDPQGQEQLAADLSDVFATRTRDEWTARLAQDDTCVGPVLRIDEVLCDANLVERGVVTTARFRDGDEVAVIRAVPWTPEPDQGWSAPLLGEDTEAVLVEAGFAASRIAQLLSEGIVGPSL